MKDNFKLFRSIIVAFRNKEISRTRFMTEWAMAQRIHGIKTHGLA